MSKAMDPLPNRTAFLLSVLTSIGGLVGFVRRRSIPSLTAGLSVGALYALSGYRLQHDLSYGHEIGLLASVLLGGASVPRAIKSARKPVPVGLSALAGIGGVVFGKAMWDRKTK